MDERVRPTWSPLEALPVGLIVYMGTLLAGVIFGLLLGADLGFVLAALSFGVLLALVTVAWVRARHDAWRDALGLRRGELRSHVWGGIGWGLALFFATTLVVAPLLFRLLSLLTGDPVVAPQQDVLPQDPTTLHVAITGLAVVLAAPVGEELFFRGFLFGGLRGRMGFGLAALVSSAAFAAAHIIVLLMPLLFVVGLGLAWVYERRGSLWPCIVAHAVFNLVGYSLIVWGI